MEERITIHFYGTQAHSPFNVIKGLDRILEIRTFNSRMAGNPREVIKLHNRIIEKEQEKKKLIETFTNQLYAYFLERKKQEEGENYK